MLSHGRDVEFASAYDLLADEKSHFSYLVSQTGQQEANYLKQQAKIIAKSENS